MCSLFATTKASIALLLLITTLPTDAYESQKKAITNKAGSAFVVPSTDTFHRTRKPSNYPHTTSLAYTVVPRKTNSDARWKSARASPFHSCSSSLNLSRYDNLVSGISEISIGFSLGVLWSEYAVITTGCGPLAFSDTLERICYQGVILAAGSSIFCRIALGKDLVSICEDSFGYLEDSTLWQVRVAEILSLIGVAGSFSALGLQIVHGEKMDGLSGIDVEMCRAIRDL